MTIHRNTAEAVVFCLTEIIDNGKHADNVIEKTLKSNPKWGSRDRRWIAECTYGIIRWYRLLQYISESENSHWMHLGAWLVWNKAILPDWEEFSPLKTVCFTENWEHAQQNRAINASIPDWLDSLGSNELGIERWERELEALNNTAEVVLRANTLKTGLTSLHSQLMLEGFDTEILPQYPHALKLSRRQNVFASKAFKQGLFEVQDAGSQLIAPFLDPKPGMCVVDACAGAGGKTLHLGALMQNKGKIVALDIEKGKLSELKTRAHRNGVSIVETTLIENDKIISDLANTADRLLLDVPCSGLGVLRRKPDTKWKLSQEAIKSIQLKQADILNHYPSILKSGGMMVYATCSILPSENEHQITHFLNKNPQYTLIEEKKIWPSDGYDGFYMAKIKKN